MQRITIGFSIHRPEIIGMTGDWMQAHEAIFLEEPSQPGFQQMLAGVLPIEEYLLAVDIEYPVFSRQMCRLLRRLHGMGKKIFQVEPFLEHLLGVHEFFTEGHGPEEIASDSMAYQVYAAERDASKALLDYYQIVIDGAFEETIDAIIRFARADAARFRLRDALRARALADRLAKFTSAYIEAGSIHYGLYLQLKQRLPGQVHIRPLFLARKALQIIGRQGHLYGPGDQLTLAFIFHPHFNVTRREALLAARSLIYTKLLQKEEQAAELETFPHIRDELACIQAVGLLTVDDCARLFPLIRRAGSIQARQMVADYLARFKKNERPEINRPGLSH
ncbi:MAG: hypothetical protein JRE88_05990 [Deltaproteobacteria bacterium]|jgi:hypothetical protein|nr:hypothetical protein [Deltaproteobacteria bacterium]MBW2516315.1 hypothetical protein [Deltaproteobacteria bacterium]